MKREAQGAARGAAHACASLAVGLAWLVASAALLPPTALGQGAGQAEAPSATGVGAIDVGDIGTLDLELVRGLIARTTRTAVDAGERRELDLEEALELALEHNLGIEIVRLSLEGSEQGIAGARAQFHPALVVEGSAGGTERARSAPRENETTESQEAQVVLEQALPTGGLARVGAAYSREFTDEFNEALGANQEETSELAGLGIEVRQPLLRGGRIFVARRAITDAELDREIARAELESALLAVTAETKTAYYGLVKAARKLEVVARSVERGRALAEATRSLFDAGRVAKLDVFSAEIRAAADQALRAQAEAQLELAGNELARVLGLPIGVRPMSRDRTIAFEPLRSEPDRWVERAVASRPELLKLRRQREKADLLVRIRRNEALPGLDVAGQYQPGFDFESYNWRAELGFDMPLGNRGARARVRQAEIDARALEREYARMRRRVELEVRGADIALRSTAERLESLTRQVESARAKAEIARGRFELGRTSNEEVTRADEQLIRAESELLDALVEHATRRAELEARVGGAL